MCVPKAKGVMMMMMCLVSVTGHRPLRNNDVFWTPCLVEYLVFDDSSIFVFALSSRCFDFLHTGGHDLIKIEMIKKKRERVITWV